MEADITAEGLENGSKRVYTTTDSDGNMVEVHEETYFVEGGDAAAAARLRSACGDATNTRQVTETLPDGSVVITTTITTIGDDGIETEEIITETVSPAIKTKASEYGEHNEQVRSGRDPSANVCSSSTSTSTSCTSSTISKPIISQYVEDEYSEYKPPKRYEKQQKDTVVDKLAPKVTIMGLPKDYQQKTADDSSEGSELGNGHGAVASHNISHAGASNDGSHKEPIFERGAVENQPVIRTDVVRESDHNEEEQLPEKGLARNLLSRFKNIEEEAQQMKQKQYRPSGVSVKPTPTPLRPAVRDAALPIDGVNDSHIIPEKYEVESQPIVRTDVAKESDTNMAEELPETGLARNLLTKFKSLEAHSQTQSEYRPSGIASKDSTDSSATWQKSGTHLSVGSTVHVQRSEPAFEGGEVENVPQVRTDVARESDNSTVEELPERGLAQNILSKFKAIESEAQEAKLRRPLSAVSTPRGGRESRTSVTSNDDLPRYQEPAVEGGKFENQPQFRTDVVRESDVNANEQLPEAGLARNLLSRFKNIESEARESQRSQFRPSGVASKSTPSKIQIMAGRSSYTADVSKSKSYVDAAADPTTDVVRKSESGEFENNPQVRTDVVRESDGRAEDLPDQGLASSLLSRFKSLEAEASIHKAYVPSGIGNKPTPTPLGGAKGHYLTSGDARANYSSTAEGSITEPSFEGGEFENQPAERPPEIAREEKKLDLDELPEQGLAVGLLSKFKNLEEDAATKRDYQPSGVGRKSLSGYGSASKKADEEEEQPLPL